MPIKEYKLLNFVSYAMVMFFPKKEQSIELNYILGVDILPVMEVFNSFQNNLLEIEGERLQRQLTGVIIMKTETYLKENLMKPQQ